MSNSTNFGNQRYRPMAQHVSGFRHRQGSGRQGVCAAETAITLPIALLIIFAMLDLGLVSARQNALEYSVRRICRDVTTHGSDADVVQTQWGPAPIESNAGSGIPMVQSAVQTLPTMALEDVAVSIVWPSGSNDPGDRVEVSLRYVHDSFLYGWLPWTEWTLTSRCTMPIVN